MPEVVARQLFEYDRRMYAPGDRLVVEDRFVRLLVALGRVEIPADPKAEVHDGAGEAYRTANIQNPPMKKDPAPKRTRNRESLVGARRA